MIVKEDMMKFNSKTYKVPIRTARISHEVHLDKKNELAAEKKKKVERVN